MTFIVLHDLYNFRLFSMNMNHHQLRAQKGFNFKRASYRGKHLKRKKKKTDLFTTPNLQAFNVKYYV